MVIMVPHAGVLVSGIVAIVVVGVVIVADRFWWIGAVGNRDTGIAIVGLGICVADLGIGVGAGVAIDVDLEILVRHFDRQGTAVGYEASGRVCYVVRGTDEWYPATECIQNKIQEVLGAFWSIASVI